LPIPETTGAQLRAKPHRCFHSKPLAFKTPPDP
jgi:hypothetical protein